MSTEIERSARLDAIAGVRAILDHDDAALQHLVRDNPQPREMAHAACGFAAALLGSMSEQTRRRVLDELTAAAIRE